MPERRLSRSRERRARRDLDIVFGLLAEGEADLARAHAARAARWLSRDGRLPIEGTSARRYEAAFAALAEAPRPAERAP